MRPAMNVAWRRLRTKTLRIDVDVLEPHDEPGRRTGADAQSDSAERRAREKRFSELARRLDSVTTDLRETVMQARMQPVGHLFQKFPRMVRDVANACGRTVRIEFSGQETGLDKSLLEAIERPADACGA